jgi:hypothetical protein
MGRLREMKAQGILHRAPGYTWAPQTWQIVDAQLGYEYIQAQ